MPGAYHGEARKAGASDDQLTVQERDMPFTLAPLPYPANALSTSTRARWKFITASITRRTSPT